MMTEKANKLTKETRKELKQRAKPVFAIVAYNNLKNRLDQPPSFSIDP